jgi:hypothetical protein
VYVKNATYTARRSHRIENRKGAAEHEQRNEDEGETAATPTPRTAALAHLQGLQRQAVRLRPTSHHERKGNPMSEAWQDDESDEMNDESEKSCARCHREIFDTFLGATHYYVPTEPGFPYRVTVCAHCMTTADHDALQAEFEEIDRKHWQQARREEWEA